VRKQGFGADAGKDAVGHWVSGCSLRRISDVG
jgi:hypothetical protein